MIRALIGALALAVLCACTIQPSPRLQEFFKPTSKGQPALAKGLQQYEEGEYADSAKSLQVAIDQGLADREQVNAHKHLAFIHCASSHERQCRDEFRKALSLEPTMELAPAEAGHPVWGPIFKSLKAGR